MPLSKLLQQKSALLVSLLLAGAVFAAFLPTLHNGFINYDDPVYVYANPHVTGGLTGPDIHWAFHTLDRGFWHPLTWLSIMLDCELFGRDAGGHHLTSLLLHTASTVLLFLVLRRLTGAQWRSALVAALFGLHPLHVESVAWASERKDVLSAFFFMLALYAYAEYAARIEDGRLRTEARSASEPPRSPLAVPNRNSKIKNQKSWYLLSLAFFTLGLMSKAMLVTLPVLLLLLDFWPLNRFPIENQKSKIKHLLLEKLPFLAIASIFILLTLVAQKDAGAVQTTTRFPLLYRLDNALLSTCQYLRQTLWPAGLAVFYSYPRSFPLWQVALALLVLGLLTAAALWNWRRRPYLAFGWAWYLLMLLPVIGIIQVGSQSRADRYTYLPLIGIFIALAWALPEAGKAARMEDGGWRMATEGTTPPPRPSAPPQSSLLPPPSSILYPLSSLLCLSVLLLLTHRQVGFWHDSETVFRHAIRVTRNNEIAHHNLGVELRNQARLLNQSCRNIQDPLQRKAIQAKSDRLEDEAIQEFQAAVQIDPSYVVAQGNLGATLLRRGRLQESIAHSREAVRLMPSYAGAHRNLGVALAEAGRLDEALYQLQLAVQLAPADAEGHYDLSVALRNKRQTNAANAQLQEALRLRQAHF